MKVEIPSISNNTVKDLHLFYQHLKSKHHSAVKAHPANDNPTIAIVGAGLSGLTAAKALTSHGINVILIEARDRVGGRIESLQLSDNLFVEMGAQFIHGAKDNPLFNISDHYHLEMIPYTKSAWGLYDMDGQELDKNQLNDLVDEYKEQIKVLNLSRQSDDKDRFTVEDLKYIDKQLLKHKAITSRDLQSLAKMISIKELKHEKLFSYKLGMNKKESESNFLVTNGYSKLTDGLLSEAKKTGLIEIHYSTEVQKIDHHSDEVIVHVKNKGAVHADALICTLPLGVLQNGNVVFEPLLPKSKAKAIKNIKCANHNKVIMQFEDVFWDNYSHFVVLYDPTLEAWLDIMNLQHFTTQKSPILVSSVYSNIDFNLPEDKFLVNHCVNIFKRMYPDTFRPLIKSWVTHWDKDPYAFGSYSYHPHGSSLEDNTIIAKPVGRLLFAGEHTHRSPSNLQAAYLSGLESAKQAIDQLLFIYQSIANNK
ncbi:MAG: flavin monoamine oxidase family protein [Candidatus Berkiella sp.]